MQAPPLPQRCVFGPACHSRQGGKAQGPNICDYCKNLNIYDLYEFADHAPDYTAVRNIVDKYKNDLASHFQQCLRKGWLLPCATKDLSLKHLEWRKSFNPDDDAPCKQVVHRGQLCQRCFTKAREQQCQWLTTDFDGDLHQFPCAFEDRRLHRPKDYEWRKGPGEDKDWEKNPNRHSQCGRREQRFKLCQPCFNRMNEMRGFSKYFDSMSGVLADRYRR